MRPRLLEIEGLQSFKETQSIDFDKLSETGLFGIFGPTGSGKSTVLDAITLALYGEVHRAVSGTQGIINTSAGSVKVSFTFDLLKDNTRKTYRVERVYNRKKDSENSCEAKIARLIEILEAGETPLADKPRDVTSKVETLLGLKHDDFTRAVVLPQNKFQEFLFLERAKRREMLERIFYLEEYGKLLSDKVSRKLSSTRNSLSNIQGALSALGDASDKALEDSGNRLKEAESCKDKIIKKLNNIESKYNEAKEVWQLVNELGLVMQKNQEHLSCLNEINDKKNVLEKAIKAEGIIDLITNYKETVKLLANTNNQLETVLSELPGLEKELNDTKLKHEAAVKESEVKGPELIQKKTGLNSALDLKKEIDAIDLKVISLRESFKTIREKISVREKKIETQNLDIKNSEECILKHKSQISSLKVDIDYKNEIQKGVKLEDELKAAKQNMDMYQEVFSQLSSKVENLRKNLNSICGEVQVSKNNLESIIVKQSDHEKAKPESREVITTGIEHYHNLKTLCISVKAKSKEVESKKTKAAKAAELLEKLKGNLSDVQYSRNKLEAERSVYRLEVERIQKLIEMNSAYKLAKMLNEGDPCPICGSTHHPVPASGTDAGEMHVLEQELENAANKMEQLEADYRDTEKSYISLAEQIRSMNEQFIQLSEESGESEKELHELVVHLPENLQKLSNEQLEIELGKINIQNEKKLKAIAEWETSLEKIKSDIEKARKNLNKLMVDEKGINSELQVNKENLSQTEISLKQASQAYSEKKNIYDDFLNMHKIQDAAGELKKISENDRQIELIQKKIEQYQQSVDAFRKSIEVLQEEKQQYFNQLTEVETDGKNLKAQKEEKERKVKDLAGDSDIHDGIRLIDENLLMLSQQEKSLSDHVKKLESGFNSLAMQKNTLENQRKIYSTNFENEKIRLDTAISQNGFVDIDDVEKSIIDREQQKFINKEIDDYEQVHRNLQAQKNIVLKKLNNRTITEDQWNFLNSDYKSKLVEKEESISGYEVAKNVFLTTKERHQKWADLSNECSSLSNKASLLEQIKSLLKGNSFVEYIAEERLRYIAMEASETLGIMTKYRYALELDSEHGFVICDNANGGVHRMVSSLSGGETFLTSLSLALALSKQIQLKGQSPLEFFFLDEGFGTLDNNLLDSVIDSLERLSTRERVIGLISHVPELKNRITRRLIIDPPAQDGKGSRVYIEKA